MYTKVCRVRGYLIVVTALTTQPRYTFSARKTASEVFKLTRTKIARKHIAGQVPRAAAKIIYQTP
jgi:hypothetical protein